MVSHPFIILPLADGISEFEGGNEWSRLEDRLDAVVLDQTVLLDMYTLPADNCEVLVAGIIQGSAYIVSDSSFNPDTSLGHAGTSVIELAPSTSCATNLYVEGNNWVTG